MSKSRLPVPLLATVLVLAACGGRINVQVAAADGAPVEDVEVQFLPFDRDSLFAELISRSATPEPEIPADLEETAAEEMRLGEVWRTAADEWSDVRETMVSLTERLDSLDQRAPDYRRLFNEFEDLEDRERALDRQRQTTFAEFTAMQEANQQRVDSLCIVIGSWEEVAFADYVDVEEDLLAMLGREVMADTTDASGAASASASGGPWWVHARHRTSEGELYWNVMVEEAPADTLRLNQSNAELRQGVRQRC